MPAKNTARPTIARRRLTYSHVYHRSFDRRTIFRGDEDVSTFINLVASSVQRVSGNGFELLAYALVPNHFHFVVRESADGLAVARFMHRTLHGYARHFNATSRRGGALFEGPYRSRQIRGETDLRTSIAYVHLNPQDPTWLERSTHGLYADFALDAPTWLSIGNGRSAFGSAERYLAVYELTKKLREARG